MEGKGDFYAIVLKLLDVFIFSLRNNYKQNSLIDLLEHRMAAFLGVNLYGAGIKEGLIHSLLGSDSSGK